MYKSKVRPDCTQLEFREMLCVELVDDFIGRDVGSSAQYATTSVHTIIRNPELNKSGSVKSRRCCVCILFGRGKKPSTMCRECNKGVCVECFAEHMHGAGV
jgi:hypothetical protein